jgi:WD40 repeat protein
MWIQKVPGLTHITYAPDGRTLYSFGSYGTLSAWDIAARTSSQTVRLSVWVAGGRGIFPLADGQRIVSLHTYSATIFDANTGRELGGVTRLTDHKPGLRNVTPEGRIFYIKSGGFAVRVWNLTTHEAEPEREIPKSARRGIRSYDVSVDGQSVALIGTKGSVAVYDWGEGSELQNPLALDSTADNVQFSPDGRTLALFSGRQVQMWDLERGAPRGKAVLLNKRPDGGPFAFHPTAPVFAAINRDKLLTLFSTETGEAIRSLDFGVGKTVTCVCFSPDGLTCAVGGSNKQFAVFDVDL